jgi:hypothetical protein
MLKRGGNERGRPRGYVGWSGRLEIARERVTRAMTMLEARASRLVGRNCQRECGGINICPSCCHLVLVVFWAGPLSCLVAIPYRAVGNLLWSGWSVGDWLSLVESCRWCVLPFGQTCWFGETSKGKGASLLKAKGKTPKNGCRNPKLPHLLTFAAHGRTGNATGTCS